jgi:hypothetical protein
MTKHFDFSFREHQELDDVVFDDIEYPHSKHVNVSVAFTSDTRWDNIILEFARFLDSVGYVGVHDRVSGYVNGYLEPLLKAMEKDDEDINNPGLSD